MPRPAQPLVPPALLLLGLLAAAVPARADMPTSPYLPPAAERRHPAEVVGRTPVCRPVPSQAGVPAGAPISPPVSARVAPPPRRPPPEPPLPDRGRQILDLQLMPRGAVPARPLSPSEASAIWRGYTGRIGKAAAPTGSGGASGGAGAGSGAAQ